MSHASPRLHSVKRRTMEWRLAQTPYNDGPQHHRYIQPSARPAVASWQQSVTVISLRSWDRRRDSRN